MALCAERGFWMAHSDRAAIPAANTSTARTITVRKLVAVDMVFHGSWFILTECAFAIALGTALGLWISHAAFLEGHAFSPIRLVLGAYFLCAAINYVPLLLYAMTIAHHNSARAEVAAELAEGGRYAWKYGVRQLWLFVPLVIPMLAVVQELRARRRTLVAK
jgi:hypothetical protein